MEAWAQKHQIPGYLYPGSFNTFADMLSRFSNASLQPRDLDDDSKFESERLAIRRIHGESWDLENDNSTVAKFIKYNIIRYRINNNSINNE
jgi:hypothetical protein